MSHLFFLIHLFLSLPLWGMKILAGGDLLTVRLDLVDSVMIGGVRRLTVPPDVQLRPLPTAAGLVL